MCLTCKRSWLWRYKLWVKRKIVTFNNGQHFWNRDLPKQINSQCLTLWPLELTSGSRSHDQRLWWLPGRRDAGYRWTRWCKSLRGEDWSGSGKRRCSLMGSWEEVKVKVMALETSIEYTSRRGGASSCSLKTCKWQQSSTYCLAKDPVELKLLVEGYYMVEEPSWSLWCSFSSVGPDWSFCLSFCVALRRATDWLFFFQVLSVDLNLDSS